MKMPPITTPFLILATAAAATLLARVDAYVVQPISNRSRKVGPRTTFRATAPETDSDTLVDEENREAILSDPMFIDEPERLGSRPPTALDPDEMVFLAKRFLATGGGIGGDPNLLAESFTFEGPVVGPLSKNEFLDVTKSVDFAAAFPDFTSEFYGFFVDPFDGDRVWFTGRGRGKNTGPLVPFIPEESGTKKMVVNPPQVCSLTIDHSTKLITRYTIGYVVDRSVGNTGGLGGLYGTLYALGRPLPFPEANPWKKSIQYDLFQKVGGLLGKLQKSNN